MKNVKLNNSKILFLCSTDNMIWQFLLPHIKDLQNYGATVDCVCAKTGFWFDELKNEHNLNLVNIPITRMPLSIKNLKAYFKIKKLQKQNNYDLIYCQQAVGGMLGRFIGKKYKIPVIYTAHGYFFFKGNNPIKNLIYKFAEKLMSRWTDVSITINDEDYNQTKKFKCKKCYKISGIGLDLEKYNNEEFDKQAFKESLGLNKSDKVVLSVAEFIRRKNHKTMIKAFAKLANELNDVKFVMCGSGELIEKIKKLVKKLNIDNKTIFLGYRKEINKIMQVSDVFFHQSLHEGLTMSIMEAMNFGLPIVASNVRGNADLIDVKGGILTLPYDIKAQTQALKQILTEKETALNMSEFNKIEIKKYLLKNIRQELKQIYKDNELI